MEYEFKFTQQEVQVLNMALGELPLKLSVSLFGKIQKGVKEQDEKNAIPLADLK